ncbi:MAG TPA: acetate--CoA ligase family protein [Myxococcota bacterium]|nr:acetate--CoA ligase family protein [Myxococcota bacterium]
MSTLDSLFFPKNIAVIGASNRPHTIGHRIIANLKRYGFTGTVTPVNPKGGEILGLPVAPSILDVPGDVDMVHIIVRNNLVVQTIEACADKGVKVAIINTSGFKELNAEGAKMEEEIAAIGRRRGIRLFGPNCQGVMNSDPRVSLYSNFTFAEMRPGHISMVAQGGGVAEVINNYFGMHEVGQRMYASNGNACDISVPEIIEYYGDDPETHVIVLHAESFADPRDFLDRVRPVAAKKPILALKSGTTEEGARAASSHTGGLMARDTISDVLFDKCGVLRFSSLEELCQTAEAFATQKVPRGRRVGMVTNAGSPAIIVTDEAVKAGLDVPELSQASKDLLKEKLQAIASIANPIDMMATAAEKEFGASLEALIGDPGIDAIVVCFMTPFFVDTLGIAKAIETHARKTEKTMIAVAMTNPAEKIEWRETLKRVRQAGLPVYYFPETAARVLHHMDRYRRLHARPRTDVPAKCVTAPGAAAIIEKAAVGPDGFMAPRDVSALLSGYGLPLVPEARSESWNEVRAGAADVGYPVVLKAEAPTLVHKSDSGGVVLDLQDEDALRAAFDGMSARLAGTAGLSYLVQKQVSGGLEVIVGGARARDLGQMVMFGLGGIHVEVLKDVIFKLAPLTDAEAREMLTSIAAAPLLDGVRGRPAIDKDALVDILLRVSCLLSDHPEISELDLNPVLAAPAGQPSLVVDARIKLVRA